MYRMGDTGVRGYNYITNTPTFSYYGAQKQREALAEYGFDGGSFLNDNESDAASTGTPEVSTNTAQGGGSQPPSYNSTEGGFSTEASGIKSAASEATSLSGGAGAAIGGAAIGVANLVTGLASPALREHAAEQYANFSFNLGKKEANATGMPLANALGFGQGPPQATIHNGLNQHTTAGQGQMGGTRITPSTLTNGYWDF